MVNMRDLEHYDVNLTQLFGFGGPRSTNLISGVVIHTTESADSSTAEGTARWQASSETGSYHDVIDASGKVVWCNTDDWITWSAGPTSNTRHIHVSFNSRASWSRKQWLQHDVMLRAGAKRTALRCYRYGIPVRFVTGPELARGARGITSHYETTRAWHETDHTDPGPNFPWDLFLLYVQEYLGIHAKNVTVTKGNNSNMVWNQLFTSAVNNKMKLPAGEMLRQIDGNAWRLNWIFHHKYSSIIDGKVKLSLVDFIRNIDAATWKTNNVLTKKYPSKVKNSGVKLTLPDAILHADAYGWYANQKLNDVLKRLDALEKKETN